MKHLGVVALALAAGCGGSGTPVSGSRQLVDLSASERVELCEYWIDQIGPRRTVTCENGDEVETGASASDAAECAEDLGQIAQEGGAECTITVDDYDACIEGIAEASDAQICEGSFPTACAAIADEADMCTGGDDGGDDEPSPPPDDL